MAKKSAKKAAPPQKKPAKKAQPTAKLTAKLTAKPAAKATKTATAAIVIDNDKIGHAAGDVWGFLHGKGWQTLAAVKKGVEGPADVTTLALGWLAREGKLDFATSGRSVKVTLRA